LKICKETHPAKIKLEKLFSHLEKENIDFSFDPYYGCFVNIDGEHYRLRDIESSQYTTDSLPPTTEYHLEIEDA
jgi:hypothetical protein